MHVWLGDIFDDDGDVVVPSSNRLVIGRGDESSVLVHECDGVDRSQVLVVCLDDLMRSCVILRARIILTELTAL